MKTFSNLLACVLVERRWLNRVWRARVAELQSVEYIDVPFIIVEDEGVNVISVSYPEMFFHRLPSWLGDEVKEALRHDRVIGKFTLRVHVSVPQIGRCYGA